MRIAINTQLLIWDKLDGMGWFTYEIVTRLAKNNPEEEFLLIFDRPPNVKLKLPSNSRTIILRPQSRHPLIWFLRFELLLPFLLKKLQADVYVAPDGWMTLGASIPCIHILHDINFAHNPQGLPFFTRLYYNFFFPRYAKKAKRIATVSNFSKSDISKSWNISPEKIDVMYNGYNEYFHSIDNKQQERVRAKYTGGNPYFIFVGALIPRKNITGILRAFDDFKKDDDKNTKLVIVGQKMWKSADMEQVFNKMNNKNDILFLGRKNVEELNDLYGASVALVFVPFFEGFGIPVLEAFTCQTPVICSNVTSLPEVAGDAALLVDPTNNKEIANAMKQVASDKILRERLIRLGDNRKENFSWDKTADKLWETIQKTVAEKSHFL